LAAATGAAAQIMEENCGIDTGRFPVFLESVTLASIDFLCNYGKLSQIYPLWLRKQAPMAL
jgi:hypothetical protein